MSEGVLSVKKNVNFIVNLTDKSLKMTIRKNDEYRLIIDQG